jgi:tetratricopeptide (TPR) repeat protein
MQETLADLLPLTDGTSHPMLALARPMSAMLGGDVATAQQLLGELAHHPDPWLRAAQDMFLGQFACQEGRLDTAAEHLARGYAAFQEIGDHSMLMVCLSGQADLAMARSEPGRAIQLLEQAREHAATGLAVHFGEMMLVPLSRARAMAGDLDRARADLEQVISTAERLAEYDDQVAACLELSDVARRQGDLAAAQRLVRTAIEVAERRSARPGMHGVTAAAYSAAGCLAEQEGDLAAATRWHAKAMTTLNGSDLIAMLGNPSLAAVVEGLAALAAARGEATRGAELLGLAAALRGYRNDWSLDQRRALAAVSAALSPAELAAAFASGQRLGRKDALALVP